MSCGKIVTVTGPIDPSQLGITLTHEHLVMTSDALGVDPPSDCQVDCHLPLKIENLGEIRQNPYYYKENFSLIEEYDTIIDELKKFKRNGGMSMVENSTIGLLRNVSALRDMSKKTGVQIIAGAGYYVGPTHTEKLKKQSVEEICSSIVSDITVGADGTDIKCGVIGEIGCCWPLYDSEKKVLQASAMAQVQTGAPIIIHPGRDKKAPFDIMRILQEAGGKAEKIVMSHLDRTIEDLDKLVEFAAIGCYCEYDLFGIETSHYQLCKHVDMPSDAQRIWRIKHLLDAGFEDKILIGQDIHTKHRLEKYGGHGYSHILNNVLPMMKIRGITEKQIDKMLVKNPAVWLTFE